MAKKRKRHRSLRMVGQYRALNNLPESHIARRTVIAHDECRRSCVGKEIAWPGRESESFDQEWYSELLGREFSFSSFAYCFISFTLTMEEWINHPPTVTDVEKDDLIRLPLLLILLDECEAAATRDENRSVISCISKARDFFNLWRESILLRVKEDDLPMPNLRKQADPRRTLFPESSWF